MHQSSEKRIKGDLIRFCGTVLECKDKSHVDCIKRVAQIVVGISNGDSVSNVRVELIRHGRQLSKKFGSLPEILDTICGGSTPELRIRNTISATRSSKIFTHVAAGELPESIFPRPSESATPVSRKETAPQSSAVSATLPAVLVHRNGAAAPQFP